MSSSVLKINSFFHLATKHDIQKILETAVFSERQTKIIEMFYIKKQGRGFTADTLCISQSEVSKELRFIREKMLKVGEKLGYFREKHFSISM